MSTEPDAGGFTYGDRSLDELRALSGSVDVGRIAETQHHFASVADQVDHVVDELIALRRQLPGWWEGSASEAALTAFDQVINHAQTTHEVASGAAKALKTCAAVVSEQQAAIDAIPEVTAPSNYPTNPPSPFSSVALGPSTAQLEAARYSSARGRAAHVVSGIAAQFVETRAQLGNLVGEDRLSGEEFRPIRQEILTMEPTIIGLASTGRVSLSQENGYPSRKLSPLQENPMPAFEFDSPAQKVLEGDQNSSRVTWTALSDTRKSVLMPEFVDPVESSIQAVEQHQNTFAKRGADTAAASPFIEYPAKNESADHAKPTYALVDQRKSLRLGYNRADKTGPPERTPRDSMTQLPNAFTPNLSRPAESVKSSSIEPNLGSASEDARPIENPSFDLDKSNAYSSSTAMPSSFQATSRDEDERGKRPDYLKEPTASWLVTQLLAPSNGILTPDWPGQT